MQNPHPHDRRLVGWLSLAQLISWGSIFYTFALVMAPVERELGLSRAESSLAFSLALLVEGLMAFAVVTRRFPHDFRRAIITMTFLGGLASTVFIPLTAGLIAAWGWRHAFAGLALLHLLVCAPLHALMLRGAPRPAPRAVSGNAVPEDLSPYLRSAPFLLIGLFVILMMAVTVALPAHMVSLLRENGMQETWVIAIPASIGLIQVLGRLLLYFFEHHFDLHLANRLIPCLIPLGLLALLAAPLSADGQVWAVLLFVLLYGMGNGMLTIVKGTAMAQYVNRTHVASLNGALGVPLALAQRLSR